MRTRRSAVPGWSLGGWAFGSVKEVGLSVDLIVTADMQQDYFILLKVERENQPDTRCDSY